MKDTLKGLGWSILGLTILPIAKVCASGLVALVNKSPRTEDNKFLEALCENILNKLADK